MQGGNRYQKDQRTENGQELVLLLQQLGMRRSKMVWAEEWALNGVCSRLNRRAGRWRSRRRRRCKTSLGGRRVIPVWLSVVGGATALLSRIVKIGHYERQLGSSKHSE